MQVFESGTGGWLRCGPVSHCQPPPPPHTHHTHFGPSGLQSSAVDKSL